MLQICKIYIRSCLKYCSYVWEGRAQHIHVNAINNPTLTDKLDCLEHKRNVADLIIFSAFSTYNVRKCTYCAHFLSVRLAVLRSCKTHNFYNIEFVNVFLFEFSFWQSSCFRICNLFLYFANIF